MPKFSLSSIGDELIKNNKYYERYMYSVVRTNIHQTTLFKINKNLADIRVLNLKNSRKPITATSGNLCVFKMNKQFNIKYLCATM